MQLVHLTPVRPRRPRYASLLCVGLLATSALSAAAVPAIIDPLLNRDLLLSVAALLGVLVGMERLAAWRLGVNRRREALDVSHALRPEGGGSATPEISPVAWRAVLPGSRSSRTISP